MCLNFVPDLCQTNYISELCPCYVFEWGLVKCLTSLALFFTWPRPLHGSSSPVTIPPFAVLNLMPKSPSGPPGLWLAVRMIPPMALYFLITQEMAGLDIIPWCPMIRRPTWGNVGWYEYVSWIIWVGEVLECCWISGLVCHASFKELLEFHLMCSITLSYSIKSRFCHV